MIGSESQRPFVAVASGRPEPVGAADRDAIARTLAGETAAFEEIVRRYERPIFAHLLRMTKSREDAEDLAQETFLRALRGLGRFDSGQPFKPWLYRIATNAALTELRKRKPNVVALDEEMEIEDVRTESAARRLDGERFRERLARAVADLPAESAALFNLRYGEELPIGRIAQALGRRPGAVAVALHRLRGRLRALLSGGDGHEMR